jgi:integrase
LPKFCGSESDNEHHYNPPALVWRGWHAARRGLGTTLYRLGVPIKTIQMVLRHSEMSTTERCYVKLIETDVQAAMDKLDSTIETPMSHTPATKEIVN